MAALIAAQEVSYIVDKKNILDRVSLSIEPGTLTTLIGPNGAGKTTLLRCLLGLITPTHGVVVRRPKLRIGYTPQRLNLDPVFPMTVQQLLSIPKKISLAQQEAVLLDVGLERVHLNQLLVALSSGQLQRLLLARALMSNPDLLVLDEPAQGVDLAGQAELYERIYHIRRTKGCGVLMVSHDLSFVMASTERVVCLNRHVCCEGSPTDLKDHPDFRAMFGRLTPEHLAWYPHHHDHSHEVSGQIKPICNHGAHS
ncbi:MAG: ATP-binding cassette domain-containing protein [Pseudomonadota bacterium]